MTKRQVAWTKRGQRERTTFSYGGIKRVLPGETKFAVYNGEQRSDLERKEQLSSLHEVEVKEFHIQKRGGILTDSKGQGEQGAVPYTQIS